MIGALSYSYSRVPEENLASPARQIIAAPVALSPQGATDNAPASEARPLAIAGFTPILAPSAATTTNDQSSGGQPAAQPQPQAADPAAPRATREVGPDGQAELTAEEQAVLRQLQATDRAVRAHEAAHASAGAGIAGAPSYTYATGPDGRQYAVGGEVSISTDVPGNDPKAAIQHLEKVVRAALAPAQPSGQDRAVAAQAQAQIGQLRAEVLKESRAEANEALAPDNGENAGPTQPSTQGGAATRISAPAPGSGEAAPAFAAPIGFDQARDRAGETSRSNPGFAAYQPDPAARIGQNAAQIARIVSIAI